MSRSEQLKELSIEEFSSPLARKEFRESVKDGLWRSEEKLIDRYFPQGSKILGLGCGAGRTTFPLANKGYQVTGVDITPSMIDIAREVEAKLDTGATFEVGDATDLEFCNNSFDHVLFSFCGWDQIPGSDNRLRALQEIKRVLKPEGYYLFTSHLRQWRGYFRLWLKQWLKLYLLKPLGFPVPELEFGDRLFYREYKGEQEAGNKQFIHIPSLKEVKRQVKQAGFELVMHERRNTIAPEDKELDSENCAFFVCQRPE